MAAAADNSEMSRKEMQSRGRHGVQKGARWIGGILCFQQSCRRCHGTRRLQDKLAEGSVAARIGMIAGYAHQGIGQEALRLHGMMELEGYAQQGMGQKSLSLHRSMQQEDLTPPNSVTYIFLLQACASVGVGALVEGKQLHAEIEKQGLGDEGVLDSSLVNMYAKCGSLEDARKLFDKLVNRNIVAWTAMIAWYSQQGMGQETLRLHSSMQQAGPTPIQSHMYACCRHVQV